MKKQDQEKYTEKYHKAKETGVPFFPDIIFKDAVVSLIVFLILIALVFFVGAPLEARANPNDTNYTPRPEWYFLFLFQMLKYFPGNLEVVGAMILPTVFIIGLILLPFIDPSPYRHYLKRPLASLVAIVVVAGIGFLTYLATTEVAPPQAAVVVDQAAALYAKDCANCHGQGITVPSGVDLHKIIAVGNHQGMPAWGGDLSSDEIDMLVGFLISPNGSALFTKECGNCHKNPVLASGNPVQLQRVFDEGLTFAPHKGKGTPDWKTTLTADEQNSLLNFLAAPDGQRLFAINCAGCHGQGVGFTGTKAELKTMIVKGGHEVKMPGWQGTLSAQDLNTLAEYVVDPKNSQGGEKLFGQFCVSCHGDKVPTSPTKESALQTIAIGGSHVTMPVWGDILTPEQVTALTNYSWDTSQGVGVSSGAKLFASNCIGCHGKYGEGGPNPSFQGDMILPISSSEFLATRDDLTIRNIIMQGQPNYGMSPFGGVLNSDQIDALVAFIRSWQTNPPAANPPKAPSVVFQPKELSAKSLYDGMCAQCHGTNFEGTSTAPALDATKLRAKYADDQIFSMINNGVLKVAMPGVGHMFTEDQVKKLVVLVAGKDTGSGAAPAPVTGAAVSFKNDVQPIFQAKCSMCHNSATTFGGWDSSTYKSATTSGTAKSAIVPGDADKSPIIELLMDTNGVLMPPTGTLSDEEIQIIRNWIIAGALDN